MAGPCFVLYNSSRRGIVKNFFIETPFSKSNFTKSILSCSSACIIASSRAPRRRQSKENRNDDKKLPKIENGTRTCKFITMLIHSFMRRTRSKALTYHAAIPGRRRKFRCERCQRDSMSMPNSTVPVDSSVVI